MKKIFFLLSAVAFCDLSSNVDAMKSVANRIVSQQKVSKKDVVTELRSISRDLTEKEQSKAGDLLSILNLPKGTKVMAVDGNSLMEYMTPLPKFKERRTLLKQALTDDNAYRTVVADFFNKPDEHNLQFTKIVEQLGGSDVATIPCYNLRTFLFDTFSKCTNKMLKQAFITFVARIESEPTRGATYFHPEEVGNNVFDFFYGDRCFACYKQLAISESTDESDKYLTIFNVKNGSKRCDDSKAFKNTDINNVLLHEVGHLIDPIMNYDEAIEHDKTTRIMYKFTSKTMNAYGCCSEDYKACKIILSRFVFCKKNNLILQKERYLGFSRSNKKSVTQANLTSNKLKQIKTTHTAQSIASEFEGIEKVLRYHLSGEAEFCQQIVGEKGKVEYIQSSAEFWKIIGLRLIEETPNNYVLYINMFSDFYNSLQNVEPIRMNHLSANISEFGDCKYNIGDIVKVYRALAGVYQVDFNEYFLQLLKK